MDNIDNILHNLVLKHQETHAQVTLLYQIIKNKHVWKTATKSANLLNILLLYI